MSALIKTIITVMIDKNVGVGLLRDVAHFLIESIFSLDLKRELTAEEKKALRDAYQQSIQEGNSLAYEKALNPRRVYPSE